MSSDKLPNWFDFVVLLVLAFGLARGRKRGISEELLEVLRWLTIVVLCAMVYRPLGNFLSGYTHLNLFLSYVGAYVFCGVLIALLFGWFKRMVGEKLVESDVFGRLEYYLGMMAGALRFFCILLAALAILHAYTVTPEAMAARAKANRENFGNMPIPSLGSIRQAVFSQSQSGPLISKYLGNQLIVAAQTSSGPQREGIARRREKLVNEVIDTKPKK